MASSSVVFFKERTLCATLIFMKNQKKQDQDFIV
mgnify:CR=1 FL=1|jgi:hypothetical protein